jgi:transcriptional regulator with XRE-family HTH domain
VPEGKAPQTVGSQLADLRRAAGVTGRELARRIHASQAKVSRIENGSLRVKPADVIAIGRALEAPDHIVRALVERVATEPQALERWRAAGPGRLRGQQDIGGLEQRAAEIRCFQVAVPPGLLQTASFAQVMLADYSRRLQEITAVGPLPAALTARMWRQEVLNDTAKVFLFVLAETALQNRVARPAVMLEQVDRIREVATRPNILIRVLRWDTELAYPPLHDFELLDDRAVVIDTMTTTVVVRDAPEVNVYRRVFESFWTQATPDISPVLDHYTRLYADLAGAPTGAAAPGPPAAVDEKTPSADGHQ